MQGSRLKALVLLGDSIWMKVFLVGMTSVSAFSFWGLTALHSGSWR